jgi:hypothetical protein
MAEQDLFRDFVSGPRERATVEHSHPFLERPADAERWSNPEIEETVAFMAHSSAVQLERIQAHLDGAVLAAEQVQDKRLEVLERGPEVSGTAVLFEFAITLILESPLAAKFLQKATKIIFTGVIKRRIAAAEGRLLAAELRRRTSQLRLVRQTRWPSVVQRLEAARIADLDISRIADELKTLHASFDTLGSGSWRDYLIGAVKGARAAGAMMGKEQPHGDPSDTPGVRILSMVQSYAANHRLANRIDIADFEFWLRSGLVAVEDVRNIFAWSSLDIGLEGIRDEAKRYYEVLIWSILLWQQAKIYKEGMTGRSLSAAEQVFGNLGDHVPYHLLRYWLYRFINPESGEQFAQVQQLQAGGKTYDRSVAALSQYMQKLARQADKSNVTLTTAGLLSAKT